MNEAVLGPDARGVALVQELTETHQTPFYVYDTTVFTARIEALRATLPAGSRLLYSVKANPNQRLLASASAAGCGLELASPGELERAITAGLDPATAVLVGPAKPDAFLATALAAGVGTLVVESITELRRLEAVAERMAVREVPVLLRLSLNGAKGSLRMSGHQFGMARDDIMSCHAVLASSAILHFAGYHGYLASQLLDATEVLHNAGLVLDEVDTLTHDVGVKPDSVDLGGGFGIPYTPTESALDLSALAEGLARILRGSASATSELLFESGRFLAGPAGALVCRVVDTKTIGGRRFVLVDAGMNSSGIFGGVNAVRILTHDVIRDSILLDGGSATNICGPLCTPMDRLATSVMCPAEVGDLVVWWNMGAYGFTAAPTGFLSFPPPAEVVV